MKCIDCAVEKTFVKVARTSLLFSLWVLLTSTLVAQAQTYPSKPIKLVVPSPQVVQQTSLVASWPIGCNKIWRNLW